MKLSIELVPSTSWYNNVRSIVKSKEWNIIRKKCYTLANNICEICGDNGFNQHISHNVECHEIWEYDDNNHIQTLIGLIALCPYCHKTKHIGLARLNGEEHIAIKQLIKINNITKIEAIKYIDNCFEIWNKRNAFSWTLNTDYLIEYLK